MTKVRKTAIILTLPLLLLLVVSLSACGAVDYSSVAGEGSGLLYSAADMKSGLKEFLENNADRTSLVKELKPEDGDGEKKAAEWIADKLEELTGVRGKVESTGDRRVGQDVFSSQNVVYSVRSTSASGKRIVIGAHYDNLYADVMSASGRGYYTLGTKAEGAVGNGAAVAVMLEMCRYFGQNADRLNTNVDFVFYGMGCVDYGGAEAYRESLGENGRENTILAVTLDGLGGDELWMYFDETETAHGEFMMNIASTRGYGELVGEPPVMQADPAEALSWMTTAPSVRIAERLVHRKTRRHLFHPLSKQKKKSRRNHQEPKCPRHRQVLRQIPTTPENLPESPPVRNRNSTGRRFCWGRIISCTTAAHGCSKRRFFPISLS